MALVLGTYRATVRTKAILATSLPSNLTFIQGASIPLAFVTAYRALIETAQLTLEDTILITSAFGSVG